MRGKTLRQTLTRERIVLTAVELIERDGEAALSMRGVASKLNVAVMSLYNHVPNKAALLAGVAEHVMGAMYLPDDDSGEDWKVRARNLIQAFRRAAREYPECVNVALAHHVDLPVGIRPVERALAIADAAGFDGRTSVRIMHAMMAYALGAQMREAGAVKMLNHLDPATTFTQLDAAEFPHVLALATELVEHDPETDFEFGLDLLISALDALPRRTA